MKKTADRVDSFLADLAGGRVTVEEAFEYREDGGIRIALPQVPSRMSLKKAANMLLAQAEAEEAMYEFDLQIQCRPSDGAYAFNKVFKELYGMTTIGKTIHSFFGTQPPQLRVVPVSPTETIQVPFGLVEFPPWSAQFNLSAYLDPEYGLAFQIHVLAKKKKERQVQGLLQLIQQYVKQSSIYRNKAMRGVVVTPQKQDPEFYNPYEVDRTTVAYSKDVYEALVDQVWGVIECAEQFRQSNRGFIREGETVWLVKEDTSPTVVFDAEDPDRTIQASTVLARLNAEIDKRNKGLPEEEREPRAVIERTHIRIGNNVLLHGENGTGKTLAAAITGQFCLENDWTFVEAKWNENLTQVLRFVEKVGSPAVVVIEDVENLFGNKDALKSLLGEFDGMRTKGFDLMLLMTSNHVGELPKSMLGGHRIDHTIYVSDLDTEGVERLINVLTPASQREELDYSALHAAYEGFTPSWIVRNLEDVAKHSIIRTKKIGQPHATDDFVRAAHALRPAWTLHQEATDRPDKPTLDTAMEAVVEPVVERVLQSHYVGLQDGSGDILVRD